MGGPFDFAFDIDSTGEAKLFVAGALKVLKDEAPTNGVTLRGFARHPAIAPFREVYGLRAAALAV